MQSLAGRTCSNCLRCESLGEPPSAASQGAAVAEAVGFDAGPSRSAMQGNRELMGVFVSRGLLVWDK